MRVLKRTLFVLSVLSVSLLKAQITVTSPVPGNVAPFSAPVPGVVVFGVKNTNATPIVITDVSNYVPAGFSGTFELWYHTTAITGAPSAISTTNGWVSAGSKAITASTTGITPIFTGLSISIPANATYRFAISGPANSPYYGGPGLTANLYQGGGLEIYVQDNPKSLGYGGAFPGPPAMPASFIGSITFSPTVACTTPPVAGTAVAASSFVCEGNSFSLNLSGASIGTGQTYQWQSSPDNSNWTNIGSSSTSSGFSTTQTATTYYRAAVTCGNTAYSTSVRVFKSTKISGTVTINSALPTGGTNFQNFTDAVNTLMACGIDGPVVFDVAPGSGPYNEQVIIPAITGASATNTITFNGNGATLSYLSTNTNERAVIKLNGADYVTFKNLVITAKGATTGQYGFGVQLLNDADFNTIDNCTINIDQASTSQDFAGIVVSASATSATGSGVTLSDDNTFSNNTITGGNYGITLVGTALVAVQRNKILNNTIKEFYSYGIYVLGSSSTQIEGNTFTRPTRTTVGDFYGISFNNLNSLAKINRNTITNPFGGAPNSTSTFYGIYFNALTLATFEHTVSNNRIYNLTGSGNAYGVYNNASPSVRYYHNTISLDGSATASTNAHQTIGFYQTGSADGVEFKNNIITISRGGASAKTAIYMNNPAATTTMVSDRNDLYISSTTGVSAVGYWKGAQTSLASWRSASGQDASSIFSNPLYTDLASGNLKPQSTSVNNRGVSVSVNTDFDGVTRHATAPDMGAYEFSPSTSVDASTKIAVSETPVCKGATVLLTVSGGVGQTYQWQSSTSANGVFANFGPVLSSPDTAITPNISNYYRLAVTNGTQTSYSDTVLLTVIPTLAGTYTINKNKPASETNFVSFAAAKDAMGCSISGPVVFNVEPGSGPYNEQLIFTPIRGASETNTITFNGNGNTIKFGSTNTNERAVIKLDDADHFIFDNLVIDATGGTYGYGVQFFNNADSNTIRNCTINTDKTSTSTNFVGIVMTGHASFPSWTNSSSLCDENTIANNIINGGSYGMTLFGTTALIKNNRIVNNKVYDFYQYGLYINGTSNVLVEGNELARPTRTNTTTTSAIFFEGLSEGGRVSKNRIHNLFDLMTTNVSQCNVIVFKNVDAPANNVNIVSNNLIYNINGNGFARGLYNDGSDNVQYYHNTVSLDYAASTATLGAYGFYQINLASGIELKNNIFSITRGGTGQKFGLSFNTPTTSFVSDNNNIYLSSGASSFFGTLSGNKATIDAWRTATGKDLISSTVNPLYTDAANGNLKPTAAAMDNRGTSLGISTDIEEAVRSASSPDLGAYEFTVPPCTTPPVAGAATINPSTSVCMGTPVLLSLSSNSFGGGISFQWEYATTAGGPYLPLGAPKVFPDTVIEASAPLYYRAAVTCSGNIEYSTPVQLAINQAYMPGGTYTINSAAPATYVSGVAGGNFQSFAAAVSNMDCGITGPVVFNVAPGTYTEQIRMHKVPGASNTSRVTFQSADGSAASVTLKFTGTSTNNYVLKLDSASFVTYKDMTIEAVSTTNGRAIELAGTTSYDSLVNLVINVPATTTTTTAVVGVYADAFKGGNNVIKGNTISGGSSGIYLRGSINAPTRLNVIDGNTITGSYQNGIYTNYTSRIKISNNTVNQAAPLDAKAYGLYAGLCDSAYQLVGNKVNINNTSTAVYGIYVNTGKGTAMERGTVAGNTVLGTTNNSGDLYGLVNYASTYNNIVNNVVSIKTTGANSYGLYSFDARFGNVYNNSIYSEATSATDNYAGYFTPLNGYTYVRNNIFAHSGGGKALFTSHPYNMVSDYNMLYSSGAVLVELSTPPPGFESIGNWKAATYANLQAWRDAYSWDVNSIVYKPAFISEMDLQPNLANPEVWAMHGRGVQIAGNDYDFNNAPRPTTLKAGVPDLGAYEFVPTSIPPVLTAIPAAPAAGITQTFMMGTDTVSKITWGTTVPTSVSMRRYSGVTPTGLTNATPYMYYYTDVQTTGGSAASFSKKDFFIDSWQGFINHKYQVRLGKTDATGNWTMSANSTVDSLTNVISENGLTQLFQFTALADINATPPVSPFITRQVDSSNMGKRFWVAYANSWNFANGNAQDMVLYLSAGAQPANVTVKVNGTNWVRTYTIPANTVITSDKLPKSGLIDSRLLEEGHSVKGISIESNTPIVAYAHIYASNNSGATMLMPVGTYGYEYYTLNARQNYYPTNSHSSFFVVADRDNTTVEITPSNPTYGGRPANTPFTVTLNKGEVYQVLGAYISGSEGYDLTGSKIVSVPGADGKCYPIAVFAGSSLTRLGCEGNAETKGDLLFQQVLPSQAWGKRYLTAPVSNAEETSSVQNSIYRVMVKDPATQVKRNGAVLTGLVANRYYEFGSMTADYIEADKPIMVAQYMLSTGGVCSGSAYNADGDPELFYLSPLEQAIKKTGFYKNNLSAIDVNYLTLTIPTNGLASLTIDGSKTFDNTYAHPNLPGYSVVVKRWEGGTGQSWVQSDSAFTGIVYGEGQWESYGYNVGTLVKNLNALPSISNTLSTTVGNSDYTCTNSPFKVSILVPMKPTSITWNFSQASGITPNADTTLTSPVAVDSVVINNNKYYKYVLNKDYQFSKAGTYTIPVSYSHPDIEGCDHSMQTDLTVKVVPAPQADFTVEFTNCLSDVAKFSGIQGSGVTVAQWNWNFGDGSKAAVQNPNRQFNTEDTFSVQLKLVTPDGCVGDTTKMVAVNARPIVEVIEDTLMACSGTGVTFQVKSPATGVTYNWYSAATGGTLVGNGSSFSGSKTEMAHYYVEAVNKSCVNTSRKKVTAMLLPDLATPVVVVDSIGVNAIRFKWNAVQGAAGYEVSLNGGTAWMMPSSGATGLTHTVSGLLPLQSVTLKVKANGGCQDVQSLAVTEKTHVDQIYIPNSFSPNGDGLNDVLQVYGYVVKEMQFTVFNQWGEKIYESRDQKRAWDGTHKGKLQPSGVYLYVCKLILNDGSVITKKGSINLVR